ncbi:hypothetical protein BUALT_Bualt09G0043200 [Buddleja alternifolia]|uniref:Protein TIFY n=1 Tax=Buddleja alternifolia TaxID=168488 RepID=A0AAV6X8G9_9LAMI|nr:hypothetical protein BUALT_Bualt09G0043200 [Buddleja alternifolia]
MGSSENVGSGRFGGGRSNFMQTCTLLSQYLKQKKGSFGDLNLIAFTDQPKIASSSGGAPPTATMNLLPMIDKTTAFLSDESQNKSDLSGSTETAPLTIFYGGQVIVFNDFPADKAEQIMTLAAKSSAALNHHNATSSPPSPADSTTIQNIVPAFGIPDRPPHPNQPALDSDLPIARKNSLARFLEKRKDRIAANAPYPASKQAAAAPPKPAVESVAWLGLAPQFPPRLQRH